MSEAKKLRLDQLLLERGLFTTRTQAQAAVMAGEIFSGERLLTKPGHLVERTLPLSIKSRRPKYVSRGGYKLEGALKDFRLEVSGRRFLDVGSSTGGFTDCLLQHGATAITCVDVGKGQLDFGLRQDPRVTVHEGINARNLRPGDLAGPFDAAVMDVSFISLTKVLPAVAPLVRERDGWVLALIKPQFEVGPALIGKGGIVRDQAARDQAIHHILDYLPQAGLVKRGVRRSHLAGTDGNIEFFLLAERLS